MLGIIEEMPRHTALAAVLSLLLAVGARAASPPAFPALSGVTVKAIVIERQPGADFYGRSVLGAIGPDDVRGIGVTVTIMTALLAIECATTPTPGWCRRATKLEAAVRVGAFRRTDSLPEILAEGEQLSLQDLIHMMMLQSWVDAARTIAEHLVNCQGQGWSTSEASADTCLRAFADAMMKERAYTIGMSSRTTFRGPAGDTDSTARDLAILADYALRNPTFAAIVATPQRQVRWLIPAGKTRVLQNSLQHLDHPTNPSRREGVNGVRGANTGGGWNLVTSATRSGKSAIAVVVDARSRDTVYADTDKLLDFGFAFMQRVR